MILLVRSSKTQRCVYAVLKMRRMFDCLKRRDASKTRSKSTADGRVLAVRNRGGADCDEVLRDAYTVVLNAEMRARQGAGAPPMGAYLPYATEVARTATKYCDAYMRLKD